MELFDAHCHLDAPPLAKSVGEALDRAGRAGLRGCLSAATSLESCHATLALSAQWPAVRAAVGVHPHDADTVTDAMLEEIDALASDPRVCAIGEVGLDFYRNESSRDGQFRAFEAFVRMGRRHRLPLVIHCRDAHEALIASLRRCGGEAPVRGMIHCASGPPEFIDAALGLGLSISFAGNVTYPTAGALRGLVARVPDDRLLAETDAPFLSPQPVRGRMNEPAHLVHTIEQLANLRGAAPGAVAALTCRNAQALFERH
jgi:TatD DNase family protein